MCWQNRQVASEGTRGEGRRAVPVHEGICLLCGRLESSAQTWCAAGRSGAGVLCAASAGSRQQATCRMYHLDEERAWLHTGGAEDVQEAGDARDRLQVLASAAFKTFALWL